MLLCPADADTRSYGIHIKSVLTERGQTSIARHSTQIAQSPKQWISTKTLIVASVRMPTILDNHATEVSAKSTLDTGPKAAPSS